jgi:hypothetical protein
VNDRPGWGPPNAPIRAGTGSEPCWEIQYPAAKAAPGARLAVGDRLEAEVTARTRQLKELAQHLQTIREDERSRLARELHDELGALLTAAKLDAARLKSRLGKTTTPEILERLAHLNETLNGGIARLIPASWISPSPAWPIIVPDGTAHDAPKSAAVVCVKLPDWQSTVTDTRPVAVPPRPSLML